MQRFLAYEVWKGAGRKLLDDGCQHRIGKYEDDGYWPGW
jgi:hypothetical protein